MVSSDFFNGINAARFDYPNNTAYLSVAFSNISDVIYLRILNGLSEVPLTYLGISSYYDNRHAAVTVSLDDWDSQNIPWDNANRILTSDRIHYTAGIISSRDPSWTLDPALV